MVPGPLRVTNAPPTQAHAENRTHYAHNESLLSRRLPKNISLVFLKMHHKCRILRPRSDNITRRVLLDVVGFMFRFQFQLSSCLPHLLHSTGFQTNVHWPGKRGIS